MDILTNDEASALLTVSNAHSIAREQLVADMVEAGATAAKFTADELAERGITGKRGAGLRAGRNGQGDIKQVSTLEDGTVVVILN